MVDVQKYRVTVKVERCEGDTSVDLFQYAQSYFHAPKEHAEIATQQMLSTIANRWYAISKKGAVKMP